MTRWITPDRLSFFLTGLLALGGLAVFAAVVYADRSGRAAALWHSTAVTWLGRAAVGVVGLLSSVALVRDLVDVL